MNANELADGLSKNQIHGDVYGLFNKRIQNMLRQQQAEIEELTKLMDFWHDSYNELRTHSVHAVNKSKQYVDKTQNNRHDLTDEEIGQIFADNLCFMIRTKEDADNLIECAKAILRKVQEK